MAETTINANLVPKVWEKRCWVEAKEKMFFSKFAGEEIPDGENIYTSSFDNIVYMSTDLTKQSGDTIVVPIAYQFSGTGVYGTNTLEGNEEQVTFGYQSVSIEFYRNASLWDTVRTQQLSPFGMKSLIKTLLAEWLAEKIDTMTITALTTSPTRNLYGGDAISTATVDTSDVFSTSLISAAVRVAKVNKIRPLKIKGKDYYVILAHPYQISALKTESIWQEAQQSANIRGEDNPIFSGSAGVWDGAIIYEYSRIPTYSNWGSGGNLPGARGVLLGAQAVIWAFGKRVVWAERETDYVKKGIMVGTIFGVAKTKFGSHDYACIALNTYATETYPSAIS